MPATPTNIIYGVDMAKAASPVRLEKGLMEAATIAGQTMHRSAAEQIEYWADLGRKVSKVVGPDTLLEISAGLVQLNIKKRKPISVDPSDVFAALEQKQTSGALEQAIASEAIRYQACQDQPGLLEQVHPDGTIIKGQFVDGEFVSIDS